MEQIKAGAASHSTAATLARWAASHSIRPTHSHTPTPIPTVLKRSPQHIIAPRRESPQQIKAATRCAGQSHGGVARSRGIGRGVAKDTIAPTRPPSPPHDRCEWAWAHLEFARKSAESFSFWTTSRNNGGRRSQLTDPGFLSRSLGVHAWLTPLRRRGSARERGHRVSLLSLKSLRIRGARKHKQGCAPGLVRSRDRSADTEANADSKGGGQEDTALPLGEREPASK